MNEELDLTPCATRRRRSEILAGEHKDGLRTGAGYS
jgi:hypothetical protein